MRPIGRSTVEIGGNYWEIRETFGRPRICWVLVCGGDGCKHRVARMMWATGLRAKTFTKGPSATDSPHAWLVAANRFERLFPVAQLIRGVGQRPYLCLNGRRVAVSGRHPGSELASRHFLRDGCAAHRRTSSARDSDGPATPSAHLRHAALPGLVSGNTQLPIANRCSPPPTSRRACLVEATVEKSPVWRACLGRSSGD